MEIPNGKLSKSIELVDSVLQELREPGIENCDLIDIDAKSLGPRFLQFTFASHRSGRLLPVTFQLTLHGIRLDIFNIPESLEWSNVSHAQEFQEFFMKLLTCRVLFESCGSPFLKSRLYFFDSNGNLDGRYAIRGLFHKRQGWDCDKQLFEPVFGGNYEDDLARP